MNLLVIDLKFSKQLNLSSIFSKFSTKIVVCDKDRRLVTKIARPLLLQKWNGTLRSNSNNGDVSKPYLRPVRNFNRTDGHISESIITTNLKFGTLIDT